MKKILLSFLAIVILIAGYFVISKTLWRVETIPSTWLTYSGNGVQFKYPESFGATVWKATTRPPKVSVVKKSQNPFVVWCEILGDSGMVTESGWGETNGILYSFYKGKDIGAWTLYTSTCYIFSWADANYILDFEIRSHSWCEDGNCWAYCETKFEQECKDFDIEKEVTKPVEMIVSTFKIVQ